MGVHSQPSQARANFTLITECTPKSSGCNSVYSVGRTQANYLMWRYMRSLLSYMDRKANSILLNYARVIFGKKAKAPRSVLNN